LLRYPVSWPASFSFLSTAPSDVQVIRDTRAVLVVDQLQPHPAQTVPKDVPAGLAQAGQIDVAKKMSRLVAYCCAAGPQVCAWHSSKSRRLLTINTRRECSFLLLSLKSAGSRRRKKIVETAWLIQPAVNNGLLPIPTKSNPIERKQMFRSRPNQTQPTLLQTSVSFPPQQIAEYRVQNKARLTEAEDEALTDFETALRSMYGLMAYEYEELTGVALPKYPAEALPSASQPSLTEEEEDGDS
jgi:hypothetical protein